MVLFLILSLIIIDIGLRLIILSVDVAFFVGSRLSDITSGANSVAYHTVKHKAKNKYAKKGISKAYHTEKFIGGAVKTSVKTIKAGAKFSTKFLLRLLQKIVSILWKLLIGLEAVVIVLDLLLFIIIAAVCWFWLSNFGIK